MGTNIHNQVHGITRFMGFILAVAVVCSFSILVDVDHLFGGRLWPHSKMAMYLSLGFGFVFNITSLIVMGIACNCRPGEVRFLK